MILFSLIEDTEVIAKKRSVTFCLINCLLIFRNFSDFLKNLWITTIKKFFKSLICFLFLIMKIKKII